MNSVLIKGMKKPTACYKCPLRTGKYCGILTENEKCADDGVLPHCPIVEVKHGHWDFHGLIDDIYGHGASCSVCGGYSEDNGYYCSCCGAKMDDALQRKTNPEAFKGGDDYE